MASFRFCETCLLHSNHSWSTGVRFFHSWAGVHPGHRLVTKKVTVQWITWSWVLATEGRKKERITSQLELVNTLCPSSGLVYDLCLKGGWEGIQNLLESALPEGHPKSQSERALFGGHQPRGALPTRARGGSAAASARHRRRSKKNRYKKIGENFKD